MTTHAPLSCLRRLALVALLALVQACATQPAGADAGAAAPLAEAPDPTRQLVVILSAEQRPHWNQIEADLAARHRLPLVKRFPLYSIDVQCLIYQVPAGRDLNAEIARLRLDPRVQDVQPNRSYRTLADPGPGLKPDPYAPLQWARKALTRDSPAPALTGEGVRIAVVDTGADTSHPDLKGRIGEARDLVGADSVIFDRDAHGTAVAGVIAADANNGIGIAGIAPQAKLMLIKACRYLPADRARTSCLSWTIARAIDAAILAKVRVINLSLAGPPDALVARLVERAQQSDIIIVAAAEAERMSFPAALPQVIGVVASDYSGRLLRIGWQPQAPLLAAPGIEILTTMPGGRYDYQSGSSMACAHVSGLIALLLQAHPRSTPADVRAALFANNAPRTRSAGRKAAPLQVMVPDLRAALREMQ